MNPIFIKACEAEIQANTEKKGPWSAWKPTKKEALTELGWHTAKLNGAVLNDDLEDVKQYAADVANICEKIHRMADLHESKRVPIYDHYGDFIRFKGDWREQ